MQRLFWFMLLVVIMMVALLNTSVFASASPQDLGYYLRLQERVLPETEHPTDRWSIWAIGPDGVARETGLYELAALCHQYGGYYYISSSGYWKWNYCE